MGATPDSLLQESALKSKIAPFTYNNAANPANYVNSRRGQVRHPARHLFSI